MHGVASGKRFTGAGAPHIASARIRDLHREHNPIQHVRGSVLHDRGGSGQCLLGGDDVALDRPEDPVVRLTLDVHRHGTVTHTRPTGHAAAHIDDTKLPPFNVLIVLEHADDLIGVRSVHELTINELLILMGPIYAGLCRGNANTGDHDRLEQLQLIRSRRSARCRRDDDASRVSIDGNDRPRGGSRRGTRKGDKYEEQDTSHELDLGSLGAVGDRHLTVSNERVRRRRPLSNDTPSPEQVDPTGAIQRMNLPRIASTLVILAILAAPVASQATPQPLETVRNFQVVDEMLSSAGQIGYDQIPLLAEQGYEVVVNLAIADERRNGEEGFLVAQNGLTYVHIPVEWESPQLGDVEMFFDVMEANEGRKVFVHCFANMRASAFVFMYRTLVEGVSEAEALSTMNEVWDPGELDQWAGLIRRAQAELNRN